MIWAAGLFDTLPLLEPGATGPAPRPRSAMRPRLGAPGMAHPAWRQERTSRFLGNDGTVPGT